MKAINSYLLMKDTFPSGYLSRWEYFRNFLEHSEQKVYAADNAIAEMLWYGEKTRSRWNVEYRHQRVLSGILKGKYDDEQVALPR